MNTSRAKWRTGRGGALCLRVSLVLSSFQFMSSESLTQSPQRDTTENLEAMKPGRDGENSLFHGFLGSRFIPSPL
jgi:hypothetical protein